MPLLLFVGINTPVLCLPTKPPCAGGTASIVSYSDMMRFGPKLVGGSWDSTKFWSFLLRCQRLPWSPCGSEPGRHINEWLPGCQWERANAPFTVLQRGCAVVKVGVGYKAKKQVLQADSHECVFGDLKFQELFVMNPQRPPGSERSFKKSVRSPINPTFWQWHTWASQKLHEGCSSDCLCLA